MLDVGCGTGDDVRAMANEVGRGGRAVGIDVSETLIEGACRRAAQTAMPTEFCEGDAHALPFPDAAFDVVRAERTFQHLADPTAALRQMLRVVRPGGRIIVAEPDWETLVVDGPNCSITRRVLSFRCDRARHGWIGRQLFALVRDLGVTNLGVSAETLIVPDIALADAIFELRASTTGAALAGAVNDVEAH